MTGVFIAFVIGIIFGSVFAVVVIRLRSMGSLRVDTSDPDGPYLFLELTVEPTEILKKKQVTLDVKLNERNSRN